VSWCLAIFRRWSRIWMSATTTFKACSMVRQWAIQTLVGWSRSAWANLRARTWWFLSRWSQRITRMQLWPTT
jgi:hypothetical protein